MPRFVVRYYTKNRLNITTVEAPDAEAAVAQQKKFCSEGDGFSAEQISGAALPKKQAQFTDDRWPMLRKDD